jgi:hypothetical protein
LFGVLTALIVILSGCGILLAWSRRESQQFQHLYEAETQRRALVERTLDGKAGEIKETVVATEVYGRSSDYDPKRDSIVRVEATLLRQKLRSYYENEAGRRSHPPASLPIFHARTPGRPR